MKERYLKALEQAGVSVWRVQEKHSETAELYFIKGKLDLPRFTSINEDRIVVYRDFEENGMKFRGSVVAFVEDGTTDEALVKKLKDAYYAASFVKNPFYDFPEKTESDYVESPSDFTALPLSEVAKRVADTILSVPHDDVAYLNSAEVFVKKETVSVADSNGTRVSFGQAEINGEMVAQCLSPLDVEQFKSFKYTNLDLDALKALVESTLENVRLRAEAKKAPKAGTYNVLISGEQLAEILNFYGMRSESSIIFPHYSTWQVGDNVQGEVTTGEKLNLTLKADAPFSEEGIPMKDRVLVEDGVLKTIHGGARFASYLGIEPTGRYRSVRLSGGTRSLAEMKKAGTLECVTFSDFQMDAFDGHFGGELRLALLYDGNGMTPLTGGSISASILEKQGELIFSKEQYKSSDYEGPLAVLIPGVNVAGE